MEKIKMENQALMPTHQKLYNFWKFSITKTKSIKGLVIIKQYDEEQEKSKMEKDSNQEIWIGCGLKNLVCNFETNKVDIVTPL